MKEAPNLTHTTLQYNCVERSVAKQSDDVTFRGPIFQVRLDLSVTFIHVTLII